MGKKNSAVQLLTKALLIVLCVKNIPCDHPTLAQNTTTFVWVNELCVGTLLLPGNAFKQSEHLQWSDNVTEQISFTRHIDPPRVGFSSVFCILSFCCRIYAIILATLIDGCCSFTYLIIVYPVQKKITCVKKRLLNKKWNSCCVFLVNFVVSYK